MRDAVKTPTIVASAELLATTAVVSGVCGVLAALPGLPGGLVLLLVGVFVLLGPGSLALSWYASQPRYVVFALIPLVGLAFVVLALSALISAGIYRPEATLLGMAAAVTVAAFARRYQLERRLGRST